MKRSSCILFFIVPFLLVGQVKSIDFNTSTKHITDISYQKNGLLWIGTDEGLNVFYDNEQYVFYSEIEDSLSLLNSNVSKLFNSSKDDLFVLSQGGVSIYLPDLFQFKQLPMVSAPTFIVENPYSKMFWVATKNTGYYLIDESFEIKALFTFDPLNPLSISTSDFSKINQHGIVAIDNEKTYFGTPNGFNVFNNKQQTFKRFFKGKKTQLTSNNIVGLGTLNDQIIIISENEIVAHNTSDSSFQLLYKSQYSINSILKNNKNEIVVQTATTQIKLTLQSKEFNVIENKKESVYLLPNQLAIGEHYIYWKEKLPYFQKSTVDLNQVNKITVGSQINALKVFDQLIYMATNNGVKILNFEESQISEVPFSTTSDFIYIYDQKIINLNGNTISVYMSLEQKQPTYSQVVKSNFKESVFDTDGPYVFIGNKNISIYNIETNKYLEAKITKKQLEGASLTNLKVVEDKLYGGYVRGVFEISLDEMLDGDVEITNYEYNELLNKDIPRLFYDIEKIDSLLYVTQPQLGLSVYNHDFNNLVKSFAYDGNELKSLAASTPTKLMHRDNENSLYIATLGSGLFKYDLSMQEFKSFNTEDGLLSNNIYDFLYTNDQLFFQSGSGINYFDNGFLKNITQEDGLKVNNFHRESLHQFGNQFLITGKESQQFFNVSELEEEETPFNLSLFKAVGIDELNSKKILQKKDNTLKIDYKTKTILLDIFSNQKQKAQQINYFIEKENNSALIKNGFNNQIQLNALPYYSSTISIYGINGNGIRSHNNIDLTIYNTPPWWLRIESILAYIIFMVVGVRFFVKYRERKTKERMEGERKNQELEEAKQLQNSLLPKVNPIVNGFEISTYLKPATEIGGDYYDFFYKKGDYFYAICGDATGHGVVSGIMVSVTKAGLNGIPMGSPSKILSQLNRIVKRVNFGRLRMSLSVAKFEEDSFSISSAAMPPTYYFSSKRKEVEEILVPNLPLGGIETEEFEGIEKKFEKGDVMVMISDGLPELPNHENELLDYPVIQDCIKEHVNKSADDIKNALIELSDQWANGLMNPDDITIVVIKKVA